MRTPEEICDALRRTCPLGEFVLDDNEAAIVMETAIREARAAALEEAAKVVEQTAEAGVRSGSWDDGIGGWDASCQ